MAFAPASLWAIPYPSARAPALRFSSWAAQAMQIRIADAVRTFRRDAFVQQRTAPLPPPLNPRNDPQRAGHRWAIRTPPWRAAARRYLLVFPVYAKELG